MSVQRWLVDTFHRCEHHPAVIIHYLLSSRKENELPLPALPALAALDSHLSTPELTVTFSPLRTRRQVSPETTPVTALCL